MRSCSCTTTVELAAFGRGLGLRARGNIGVIGDFGPEHCKIRIEPSHLIARSRVLESR